MKTAIIVFLMSSIIVGGETFSALNFYFKEKFIIFIIFIIFINNLCVFEGYIICMVLKKKNSS